MSDTGLVYYNNNTFHAIFNKHSSHFRHLYFNGEFEASLIEVPAKTLIFEALGRCSYLNVLDLSSNNYVEEIGFVANLKHLKELYIENCVNINEETATEVLSNRNICNSIEVLDLRMCHQFINEQLAKIGLGLPCLRVFIIDGCEKISIQTAITILNNSSNTLENVSLTPDLENYPRTQWELLKNMFFELKLC